MTGEPQKADPVWFRFEPPLVLEGGDLGAFIGRALPGARPRGVDYLDRGIVNSNYRVTVTGDGDGERDYLLRLSRSDEGSLREGAVLERASTVLGVPAPRLVGSERGDKPEAHRRALFTWVFGESLQELRSVPDAGLEEAARDLGRALARLHTIRFDSYGRFDPALRVMPPGGDAPKAKRWADDLAWRTAVRLENPAHGLDDGARERIRAGFAHGLVRLWTAPIPATLVHGDLSPGNILVARRDGGPYRLSGLVDWEMARAADPALDFASLRFELDATRPSFVSAVEEAYRSAAEVAETVNPPDLWEHRIRLAAVPMLLDARMVAWRRRSMEDLERIDGRLRRDLGI